MKTKEIINDIENVENQETEALFDMYVSSEPEGKLPFTGPSASVGRTSSFATSTCGSVELR